MIDIPDDIMLVASEVVERWYHEEWNEAGDLVQDELIEFIARAILTEREASRSRERAAWIAGRDAGATLADRAVQHGGEAIRALEPPAEFGPGNTDRTRLSAANALLREALPLVESLRDPEQFYSARSTEVVARIDAHLKEGEG